MKYCQHCGAELIDEAAICPKCGCMVNSSAATTTEITTATTPEKPRRKINAYALVGFILAMVSVLTFHIDFLGLLAVAAMALSIVGVVQLHNNDAQRGKGFALAGMVVGAYYFIIGMLYWIDYMIKA